MDSNAKCDLSLHAVQSNTPVTVVIPNLTSCNRLVTDNLMSMVITLWEDGDTRRILVQWNGSIHEQ